MVSHHEVDKNGLFRSARDSYEELVLHASAPRAPFGWGFTKERLRNNPTPNGFSMASALRNGIAVSIRLQIPLQR